MAIPDVKLVSPAVFRDDRGFLVERWSTATFAAAGLPLTFVQDNHSRSVRGAVRGLHFQTGPHAQGKLVGVTRGRVLDVAVDVRAGSPTFGLHVSALLDDESLQQLWVPAGFAHGFAVLSDVADVVYKMDRPYAPTAQAGVRWDDPALGIDWRLEGAEPVVSPRDAELPLLAEIRPHSDQGGPQ